LVLHRAFNETAEIADLKNGGDVIETIENKQGLNKFPRRSPCKNARGCLRLPCFTIEDEEQSIITQFALDILFHIVHILPDSLHFPTLEKKLY
jgi:hypothetical protein